ncbi:hypothetical protein D3C78_1262560 [compost metagenome]
MATTPNLTHVLYRVLSPTARISPSLLITASVLLKRWLSAAIRRTRWHGADGFLRVLLCCNPLCVIPYRNIFTTA